MRIERLELVGYKRLMLSNIQKIVYTPTSLYQIILGTNGSGKSSLLYELTPLPAQSRNYSKEGFKSITLTHKGHRYVLTSSFKSGNKHSFEKDGEELNPGGTMQIQRELVRTEFSVTPDLHDLIIGRTRFTEMTAIQRRDWITSLSNVDYTYPLSVFNKLKGLARDRVGAVKHLRERLAIETNALRTLEITADAAEQEHQLQHELHHLTHERAPNIPTVDQVSFRLQETLSRIKLCSDNLMSHYKVLRESGRVWGQQFEMDAQSATMSEELIASKALYERTLHEVDELRSIAQRYGYGEVTFPEDLDQRIDALDALIAAHAARSIPFDVILDPVGALSDLQSIQTDVMQLFFALPDNTDRHLSKDTESQARYKIDQLKQEFDQHTSVIHRARNRINDMESARDQTCPSCKYVWREGFSEHFLAEQQEIIQRSIPLLETTERRIQEQQAFLEEIDAYSAQCRQFRGYVQSYPRLSSLWNYILENQFLTNAPATHTDIFTAFRQEVESAVAGVQQQEEHRQLKVLQAQRDFISTHENPHSRIEALERDVVKYASTARRATATLQSIEGEIKDRDAMEALNEELIALRLQLENTQALYLQALRNELIDVTSRKHQQTLGQIQIQLTAKRNLEQIVNDIQHSLDDVVLDSEALSALVKALSPTEGLIAEQLAGFIGCFTGQLNSIIASIWTYDMQVLPCGIDSDELTYKFPLQVKDADNVSTDIREGSKAQQEIVNFAFILTVMLYRGLLDYPLYLDELGEGFDEQHRENAMTFMKHLLDVGQYSQVFMISHYMSSWSVFEGAEHLVLDSTNIAVPDRVNPHVVLG